ncbi:DUF6644 family protein [Phenylobacterium sp.]|uniref:DUF6644 family protein n=1 Tax=Phenylobacterium sp. TaxID=1871053 RepID=UPI0035AF0951
MIRDVLVWLQTQLGKGPDEYAMSWSEQLLGSLNFWGLLEGTHLLSLMLFAGTIFVVDLRLLGVTFRKTPVSELSRRVLPLTVFGFVLVILTGLALFYAKPLVYYHNIWFRAKLAFIVLALVNIMVFHRRVQRNISAWDNLARPPAAARASAVISLASWALIIMLGRFIAYDWFECGKPLPDWANALQECAASEKGAQTLAELAQ